MTLAFLITLLIAFTLTYTIYFGLIAKPVWSVYAYLIIWFVIPKAFRLIYISGGVYDFPEGLTVFNIIEAVAICGIAVALIKHHRKPELKKKTKAMRWFAWLFLLTGTISFIVSFGFLSLIFSSHFDELWTYIEWHTELQNRIVPFATVVFGVIFLYGCFSFITEKKQVETILLLFLLLGVELSVESVLLYYIPPFYPVPILTQLAAFSVQAGGRFMSLAFTSFDQVGVFAIIAIGCCLYFSQSRKSKLLLLLLPLLFLPIVAGYQRSVLLGACATIGFVYWNSSSGKKRVALVSIGLALLLTMSVLDSDLLLVNKVGESLGGSERADYFSTDSLDARFGLQIRATDVFVQAFPFGVGPGMLPTAMNSPISQSVLGNQIPTVAAYSASMYSQLASGFRKTNAHNILLEFIVEYGLLGVLVLGVFFYLLISNFWYWMKNSRSAPRDSSFFLQTYIFAILLGILIHGLFESTYFPYSMYFMFLYITFIPKLETESTPAVTVPTKSIPGGMLRPAGLVPYTLRVR